MRPRLNLFPLLLLGVVLASGCGEQTTAFEPADLASDAYALTAAECVDEAVNNGVTFCHATGSTETPYTLITVHTNACINAHVNHGGDVLPDVNGNCCSVEEQDCAGVCGGTAVEDCAGTCDGAAVEDCAGTCNGAAEEDCAGTCNGAAEEDCAGTCGGLAEEVDVVHFTTNGGVFRWTSGAPLAPPYQVSTFPSYSLAVSSLDEVFVGTGGVEATTQGLGAAGIYALDGAGSATLVSPTAAEDLQFAPNGTLHAANSGGIFEIDETTGQATQVSSNPTSQFAFETDTSVVTTNGSAYASTFGWRTDRIDLTTDSTTLLTGNGGEDIKVDGGDILLCGQGGLFEVLSSGALVNLYGGRTFNFGVGSLGDFYIGNSNTYGGVSWPQGFYAPTVSSSALDSADINALVVTEGCE
ncbi:MAG: hypothetical protein KDA24_03955 [Deltaproteobacteria bacterium]|nr:hypothetical protein [Deltaproteobacteria bacterium]